MGRGRLDEPTASCTPAPAMREGDDGRAQALLPGRDSVEWPMEPAHPALILPNGCGSGGARRLFPRAAPAGLTSKAMQ